MKLSDHLRYDRFFIAVAFIAVILVLTHLPQNDTMEDITITGADKVMHVIAYGMIAVLLAGSTKIPLTLKRKVVLLLVISVIGCADEYTQQWAGRTCSVDDWLADVVGIGAGLVLSSARWGVWTES